MSLIETILSRFRSAKIPPPVSPPGFVPVICQEADDEHEGHEALEDSDLFGQSFGMIYQAASGEQTQRRVTVRALCQSLDGHLFVRGFCWERKEPRSFRVDRIKTLYRISTGEIIPSANAFFRSYLKPLSEVDVTKLLLHETQPGLRALLFLSRCDGECLEEREAMRWYVEKRAKDSKFNWEPFSDFLDHQHPDPHLALRGLTTIGKDKAHTKCLLTAAGQLVAADGEITLQETEALTELRDALKQKLNDGTTESIEF
jgi:hypothetical protein